MTLLTCYECGNPVSSQASVCPHCGTPVNASSLPPTLPAESATLLSPQKHQLSKSTRTAIYAAVIVLSIPVMMLLDSGKKDALSASGSSTESDCVSDDIQCLGNKGIVAAGVYCAPEVERHAKHSVKWTDGTFETKFSSFRWRNVSRQQITYIGDKAEFQNGFGAFTRVIYECDLDADRQTVLEVRVREGRLR